MKSTSTLSILPLAYTLDEAIAMGLGSRSTIYRAAARGEIKLVKRNRRTLILADEAARYMSALPEATIKPAA